MKVLAFLCFSTHLAQMTYLSVGENVPAVIWTNYRPLMSYLKPSHERIVSFDELLDNYLKPMLKESYAVNIVLFLQDKLKIIDLAQYGAGQGEESSFTYLESLVASNTAVGLPYVTLPAINDIESNVIGYLSSRDNVAVHRLNAPYQLNDLMLGPADTNVIVAKLPSSSLSRTPMDNSSSSVDSILNQVTSQLSSLTHPFLAVYTAVSSRSEPTVDGGINGKRRRRQLGNSKGTAMGFIPNTFLMHTSEVYIDVNGDGDHIATIPGYGPTWQTAGYNCKSKFQCEVTMALTDVTNVQALEWQSLSLQVGVSLSAQSAYWYIDSMKLSYNDRTSVSNGASTDVILDLSSMNLAATPVLYSYHCSTTVLQERGGNMIIVLTELQLQAFGIDSNNFGYYNDCQYFFTSAIWCGLLSCSLLIAIELFGFIMLFKIETMDRFENPTGKSILEATTQPRTS